MDDNLPAFTLSSESITMIVKVFHVHLLVASQCVHHSEQFARDGHQRFDFGHAALKHPSVGPMHSPCGFDCVDGRKIEQFSHQWSSALGNTPPAFVFAGADLKEIKTGQFGNLSTCLILAKVPDLADQSGHGDQADTWQRKKIPAVRNLFQMHSHLAFHTVDKIIFSLNLVNQVANFFDNALLAFIDAHRRLSSLTKLFSMPLAHLTATDPLDDSAQLLLSQGGNSLPARVMSEQVQSRLAGDLLNHLQKLGKNDKEQVLQLVDYGRAIPNGSFSGLGKSPQMRRGSLRYHHPQGMAQHNDIGNNPRIFAIGLVGRIARQFPYTFAVHRVDLYQGYRLLLQKVRDRLRVWTGGLKAHHHLPAPVGFFKAAKLLPKTMKAVVGIVKSKRFNILAIRSSKVSIVRAFTNIQGNYHRLIVDAFDFLRFNLTHGYTPLLVPDYQLAKCNWNQYGYSLFYTDSRLTAI